MATGIDNIFVSCRKGDLARVQYLVEKREIDLNVRDCWDSTPLYYACHCGHTNLVQYLLEHGARCEENTFDGERCLYGALTNDIKRMLLDSKAANMGARRDEHDEFCEKLIGAEEHSDFKLTLKGGKVFKLHRCVLSIRSPGFNKLLGGKWKDVVNVKNNLIEPKIFEEFVKYLYTGKLKCNRDQYLDMKQLANRCGMKTMINLLDAAYVTTTTFVRSKSSRIKVTTLVLDSPLSKTVVQEDFCQLIDAGMDPEFTRGGPLSPLSPYVHCGSGYFLTSGDGTEDRCGDDGDEDAENLPYFDLCFKVEGSLFYCNKVFICTRSAYFRALLEDYFGEHHETCNKIPVISLKEVSSPVFACVLHYIYSGQDWNLTEDIVTDVIEASDIYLLPGLKRLCGAYLCSVVSNSNVIDLLQTGRFHELVRLEDRCAEYLAEHIAEFIDNEEFRNFIIQDAHEVECRQETDSIPIIDDVRYHITGQVASFAELEDSQDKLRLIDNLLEDLDLEA